MSAVKTWEKSWLTSKELFKLQINRSHSKSNEGFHEGEPANGSKRSESLVSLQLTGQHGGLRILAGLDSKHDSQKQGGSGSLFVLGSSSVKCCKICPFKTPTIANDEKYL